MKTLRWGILPYSGHFELRVLSPMARLGEAEIVAVASRSQTRADAGAAKILEALSRAAGSPARTVRAHGSYEALLADPDVDAVYISLPNDLHLEWTLKALAAGKHVLCEKPFGMDAAQARRADEAGLAAGRLVMEAFMYRFHPQWERAKEIAASGELGKVSSVETVFSYNNRDPRNIRNRIENGGGALYDIGCYAASGARYILGREPERVLCLSEKDPEFGTDRLSSALLDFGQGSRATFTVATQSAPFQQVTVLGAKGALRMALPFNAYPDLRLTVEVRTGLGERHVECGPADQYGIMLSRFSRAALDGSPAPTPMSDAIGNMATLDALFASAASGAWAAV